MPIAAAASTEVVLDVGGARVRVARRFDATLLAQVVAGLRAVRGVDVGRSAGRAGASGAVTPRCIESAARAPLRSTYAA